MGSNSLTTQTIGWNDVVSGELEINFSILGGGDYWIGSAAPVSGGQMPVRMELIAQQRGREG